MKGTYGSGTWTLHWEEWGAGAWYALHTSQVVALTDVLETRTTASSSVAGSLISLQRDRICI